MRVNLLYNSIVAKIVFFEIEKWEEELVKNALPEHQLVFTQEKLNKDDCVKYKDAEVISPFIYSSITQQVLSGLLNLKFIATRSVGFDHIDMDLVKQKGVVVSNIPKYGGDTVAQHTIALILAISRKLIPSVERTKHGDFSLEGLSGFDLYGKTLGVIGAGHIGRKVIDIAKCFGMQILVYTRTKDEKLVMDDKISYAENLDHLLSSSDIITLHVPHTPETEHIINMGNLDKVKKGAVLINTARGPLVETQAVLEGVEKGIFSAVGLDVLEEEGPLKEERELLTSEFLKCCDPKTALMNHILLTREEVIITPHNAFNSREALAQIIDTTISNIKAYLMGTPQNIVSKE
jgi:D-lactate dehydrogenase